MEFELVGRIFASELILTALLPFLVWRRGSWLRRPLPRTFLVLAGLWLAGQITTDLVRESDFADYSRGWAKIAFTISNFCSLYLLLYGNRRRFLLFAVGIVVGSALRLAQPVYIDMSYALTWKFLLGTTATLGLVLLSQTRPLANLRFMPALAMLALGFYSLILGSRSLAGVTMLASVFLVVSRGTRYRAPAGRGATVREALVVSVAGLGLAAAVLALYGFAATAGYLGEQAHALYQTQGLGDFGVLLGGRPEFYAAIRAVLDSPILGHGSWARNSEYALDIMDLSRFGYDTYMREDLELIPTHSHLMGAWVESGILGAVFWGWVLVLLARVLLSLHRLGEPLGPMIAFFALLLAWDIPFSPFGAERRFLNPYYIVTFMFAWDQIAQRRRPLVPRANRPGAPLRAARAPDPRSGREVH